jgi:hypothetical protein
MEPTFAKTPNAAWRFHDGAFGRARIDAGSSLSPVTLCASFNQNAPLPPAAVKCSDGHITMKSSRRHFLAGLGLIAAGSSASAGIFSDGQTSAFSRLKTKLANKQNASVFVNADSTGSSSFGPYYLWVTAVGALFDCTVNLYSWAEWIGSGPNGPKAYAAPVTLRSGGGPTLSMYLCALPGAASGFPFDGTRKAAALDAIPTPDLCILHHGHNMLSFDQRVPTSYATGAGLFHATVGMTSIQWPNVPQAITTQNPHRDDNAYSKVYSAILEAQAAHPNLTLVDTYADFLAAGRTPNLYRPGAAENIHPSDSSGIGKFDGAQLQSNRLLSAFSAAKSTSLFATPGWPQLTGPNILTNGDFSKWTDAFPVNCSNNESAATATKDTTTTFGGSAYSCAIAPNGSNAGCMRYTLTAAEKNALANKTISLAILFYQSPRQPRALFNFLIQSYGSIRGFVQGGIIDCAGGWYWAVYSGIPVDTPDVNTALLMYPSFGVTPHVNDPLRVQKIVIVAGHLPNGLV